ncbi:MAG: DUF1127 domain-containing protein [Salaquimonas sp.]|jgi:uncharacterized protein YjiS (DUF1127 family)|nr:DUF1127 domain-containing protein [Salaquimonas sp.]
MFESVFSRFAKAAELRRSRKALMQLSDRQLRDIGVTRDEAAREANRPFWY